MVPLHPAGSAAETAAARTLLEIIANPTAAQKRLAELIAEKQAAADVVAQAQDWTHTATQAKADAERAVADMLTKLKEVQSAHDTSMKIAGDREKALTDKAERLAKFEAQTVAHEKEMTETLGAREAAVKAREADVTKREAALRTLQEAAQQLKEDYQSKVDAFRSMHREIMK